MTLGDFYKYLEKGTKPSILINYERYSYYIRGNKDLRITFDKNVRYRTRKPDLTNGDDMHHVIDKNTYIMEIKSLDSLPLDFSRLLAKLKIYPRSFSKPKHAYLKSLERK